MSIFENGAVIVPDLITEAEETRVLERIAAAPWMRDIGRRVQHYGYRYDYRGSQPPTPTTALPRWAVVIGERLKAWFAGNAVPTQCIVNEYEPGQGIGMHSDSPNFGPVVASLSLGEAWPMRFRHRAVRPYARDGLAGDEVVVLARRSAVVLSGAARSAWMHGIDRNDTRVLRGVRVSATFRTVLGAPSAVHIDGRTGRAPENQEMRL